MRPTSLKKRIWRKNTKLQLCNLVHTFKSSYVSLSVCGGFCAHGRTPLVRINGTLKQEKYKEIIENYVLPIGTAHYGNKSNFVFIQDNCGPHKAKSVKAYLDANNVTVMKWPAQSPDLNPIENACAVLKKRLRERPEYPRNADHLFQILQEELYAILNEFFTSLIRSMNTSV